MPILRVICLPAGSRPDLSGVASVTEEVKFFATPRAWEAVHEWHDLNEEQQAESLSRLEAQLPAAEAVEAYKRLIYAALANSVLDISAVCMEVHDRGRITDPSLVEALQDHDPNEFFGAWWAARVEKRTSAFAAFRASVNWPWDIWGRRVLELQDRIDNCLADYLGKRGWDDEFPNHLDRYEFFLWTLLSLPAEVPIPPEPAGGHLVELARSSELKQLSDAAKSRQGWNALDELFLQNLDSQSTCMVGTLTTLPDRAECLVIRFEKTPSEKRPFGRLDIHPEALRDLQRGKS